MIGTVLTDAYGFLAILSGVILLSITIWTYQYKDEQGALPFILILISSAGWCIFDGLVTFSDTLFLKDTFLTLKNAFVFILPAAWVMFAIQFTGKTEYLTKPVKFVVFGGAVFFIGLSITNSFHELYIHPTYLITEPVIQHGTERRPLYWVGYVYAYTLIIGANGLLIRLGLSSGSLHKKQILLLTLGLFAPILANLLSELALFRFYNLTITSLGLGVWGILLAYVFYRHKLFNATPIARERVISGLDDAMIVVDNMGRVTDWNAAAEPLFSQSPDGQHLADIAGDDLLSSLSKVGLSLDTGVNGGPVGDGSGYVNEKANNVPIMVNGEERIYNIRLSVVLNKSGQTQANAIVLRDITELEQKRQDLERQNERLDNFAGVLAHDLRNPIGTAKGYMQLVEKNNDNEFISRVTSAHDRMENMVDDLLILAKQGADVTETRTIRLDEAVNEAWNHVETFDGTLHIDTDQTIQADPSRIANLLENLIRNSYEHAGEETTVCVGEIGDGEGFYFADDGPGIPDENRDRIFDYGYSTNADGTGFGLNIVKEIAEAHGWKISLGDDDEYGAKFEIRF